MRHDAQNIVAKTKFKFTVLSGDPLRLQISAEVCSAEEASTLINMITANANAVFEDDVTFTCDECAEKGDPND